MPKKIDLTGKRFGRLVIQKHLPQSWSFVEYLCDCGEVQQAYAGNIVAGRINSCGCFRREHSRDLMKAMPKRQPTLEGMVRAVRACYMANSKRRKPYAPFTLTLEECFTLFTADCHYCNAPPSNILNKKTYHSLPYSGIDRLNAWLGYVTDNCVACCVTCNYAKQSMGEMEFLAWVKRVYEFRFQGKKIKGIIGPSVAPCKRAVVIR